MHTDIVSAQLRRLNWLVHARVVEAKLRDLEPAVKSAASARSIRLGARLRVSSTPTPSKVKSAYRREQGMDLFGEPNWSREQTTLATCRVGDLPLMGMNSDALTYADRDRSGAEEMRDTIIAS